MNSSSGKTLKIYHMFWSKYSWEDLADGEILEKNRIGIYQIYGNHSVYGKDCLLYIGKTVEQDFQTRLDPRQHWDFDVNHFSEFTHIHIGTLKEWDDYSRDAEKSVISKIEKLLINSHTPAFNSMDVKGLYPYDVEDQFILLNWDLLGNLLPEVSTLRYSDKYWDEDIYTSGE